MSDAPPLGSNVKTYKPSMPLPKLVKKGFNSVLETCPRFSFEIGQLQLRKEITRKQELCILFLVRPHSDAVSKALSQIKGMQISRKTKKVHEKGSNERDLHRALVSFFKDYLLVEFHVAHRAYRKLAHFKKILTPGELKAQIKRT